MNKDERLHLIRRCIQYRAEIEGIPTALMNCKEYLREKEQLERLNDDELWREYEWLYEMLYHK